jgi:hypothetical protein
MATVDTTVVLNALVKCTSYEVQVRTVCLQDTTSYDSIYILETDCDVAVEDVDPLLSSINVYPNPAVDVAFVKFVPLYSGEFTLSIVSPTGQRLFAEKVFAESNKEQLLELSDIGQFVPGLYFIVIESEGRRSLSKLLKL